MKTFLITGASAGIGGAVCRKIVDAEPAPVRLVLTTSGRKPPPQDLIDDLTAQGAAVTYMAADLSDPEACRALADKTIEVGEGGLEGFVSNAGSMAPTPLADISVDTWQSQLDQNVRATLLLAQALRPALAKSKGSIVATSSMAALAPLKGNSAYSISKQALTMLCRSLAQEWARDGIRVNAVLPGMIRTPLTEKVYQNAAVAAARADFVPLGRVGLPEDIAGPVYFLLSEGAAYITGQAILADGGVTDSVFYQMPGIPQD